jgi:hypothetical protein
MDPVLEIDIDMLVDWLFQKVEEGPGEGIVAEILAQLLESSLGYTIFADTSVRAALNSMMEENDVHIGLNAANRLLTVLNDELAQTYLSVLAYEHGFLVSPPFESTDSLLWYYRDWKGSDLGSLRRHRNIKTE